MSAELPKTPPSPKGGLRILFIEHSLDDVELATQELKRAGQDVAVEVVGTREEFRKKLGAGPWDLILADYRLPGWTGMNAFGLLKKLDKDIPFILITGTLGEEEAVECIKQGITDYVLKDRMARLPVAVRRALEEKRTRDERKRAREALWQTENRLRAIVETEPECIQLMNPDGTLVQMNRAGLAMFEADDPSQVVGKSLEPLVAPEHREAFRALTAAVAKGSRRILEFEIIGLKGTRRWMETHAVPLRNSGDGTVLVLGVTRDTTERKRSEQALRESEARYRDIFENATYGIFRATREGNLLDANPALVRMLGYDSKEELLAANLRTDVYRSPEDGAPLVEQHWSKGRFEIPEAEWKKKDKTPILVRLTGRSLSDELGRSIAEVFVENITERRLLEKQVAQLQKFDAIGRLAGGIAHDFNNMIGAILGWVELGLGAAPPEGRLRGDFEKIRVQAERAAALTGQLLSFARRKMLEPRNISLNDAVRQVLGLLEKVIGSNIQIETHLHPELHVTHADPSQIEQVLMNLCLNARDAMPQGGRLHIQTENAQITEDYHRTHPYMAPGSYVLLTVSDTGLGMDTSTLEHVFEPFFTTKADGKGTGLGLATVYGIIKQHGGFVNVYSEPGRGSAFRIYFPAATGVVEQAKEAPSATVSGGTETILVAEDHEGLSQMVREVLSNYGYTVLIASDGEKAVELFRRHQKEIALLLFDVVMPKLGGPDSYERICQIQPGVPVIFTTGYSEEAAQLRSLTERGATVLQKPYTPSALARRVREVLNAAGKK